MQHIEPLESRQLLSASLHSAAKPKPTITYTFIGTLTQTKPTRQPSSEFEVTFASESSKGILAGTIQTSQTFTTSIAGTINTKGSVSLKFTNSAGKVATFTGKSSNGNLELTGKYKTPASKGVKPTSGAFVLEA